MFVVSATACFANSWAGGVAGVEVGDRVSEVERRDAGDGACEEEEPEEEAEAVAVAVAGDEDEQASGVRPLAAAAAALVPALRTPLPTALVEPAEVLLQPLFQTWGGLALPVGLLLLVLLTPLAAVGATVAALTLAAVAACGNDLSF